MSTGSSRSRDLACSTVLGNPGKPITVSNSGLCLMLCSHLERDRQGHNLGQFFFQLNISVYFLLLDAVDKEIKAPLLRIGSSFFYSVSGAGQNIALQLHAS